MQMITQVYNEDMRPLHVNPEYAALVPHHSYKEYQELERNIIEKGEAIEPIKINTKDEILDGHTRFDICNRNGLIYKTVTMTFPTRLDEMIYIMETNLLRRQMGVLSKAEVGGRLEPLYAERAKQRMSEGGKGSSFEQPLIARDQAAKAAKLSPTTYHRAKTILDRGSPELIQRVREGKTSIAYAYKTLKQEERKSKPQPIPQGVYTVVYADPPWEYDIMIRGAPDEHYRTMKTEDICALKVPSADDSILFLWATNPKLKQALQVLHAWGYQYKTNMVWVKDAWGTGYYFRGQHELLLVGIKGQFSPPLDNVRKSSVLQAQRREHSRKPEEVYEIIESYYPQSTKLELFARETRPGWASWGAEL